MEGKGELYVGIFFFVALGVMLVLAIELKPEMFQSKDYEHYVARFRSVAGLKEDGPVMLAGQRVGYIRSIDATGMDKVTVHFDVEDGYTLYNGTPVQILASSILGGAQLTLGLPQTGHIRKQIGKLKRRDDELVALQKQSPDLTLPDQEKQELENIRDRIDDLQEMLKTMNSPLAGNELTLVIESGGMSDAFGNLSDLIEENRTDFHDLIVNAKNSFDQINKLVTEAREGKGLLGKLINDKELADKVTGAVDKINSGFDGFSDLMASINNKDGEGLVPRLIHDKELADEVKGTVDTINSAFKQVKTFMDNVNNPEGEGLVPRLIHNKELADKVQGTVDTVNDAFAQVKSFMKDAQTGDGLIARLIHDEKLADDVKTAIGDVKEMIAKVKKGEGSLGQLVMDDTIADNLNRLLKGAGDAIEDAREQAPISAFGAVLLGGIQ